MERDGQDEAAWMPLRVRNEPWMANPRGPSGWRGGVREQRRLAQGADCKGPRPSALCPYAAAVRLKLPCG